MTLEKLLIFGFALAALFAITTVGANLMQDRSNQKDDFQQKIETLQDSGF